MGAWPTAPGQVWKWSCMACGFVNQRTVRSTDRGGEFIPVKCVRCARLDRRCVAPAELFGDRRLGHRPSS
jgi:hypothetical protein